MYDNVMNKFKYGNFKNARYLDHESTNMFYPVLLTTFLDLTQSLLQEGHNDLALKLLHKYDAVLPDINTYIDVAGRKMFLAQAAYQLNDAALGNKWVNNIDTYLVDQLDYNYHLLQDDANSVNRRDVQIALQVINGMADFTRTSHQTALNQKLEAQLKDYGTKFAPVLGQ